MDARCGLSQLNASKTGHPTETSIGVTHIVLPSSTTADHFVVSNRKARATCNSGVGVSRSRVQFRWISGKEVNHNDAPGDCGGWHRQFQLQKSLVIVYSSTHHRECKR